MGSQYTRKTPGQITQSQLPNARSNTHPAGVKRVIIGPDGQRCCGQLILCRESRAEDETDFFLGRLIR